MCGYTPFEVFFGRKENSNVESLDITKSQDASTELDDNDLKQWQENVVYTFIKRGKGLITGTGRVVERKNNMYKISYQRKERKSQTDWFTVSILSSTTRNGEKRRRREKRK